VANGYGVTASHSSKTQVIEIFIRNYDRCSSLVLYGSISLPHFNLSGSEMSQTAAKVITPFSDRLHTVASKFENEIPN